MEYIFALICIITIFIATIIFTIISFKCMYIINKKYTNKKYSNDYNKGMYYREIPNSGNTAVGVALLTRRLSNLKFNDPTNTLYKIIQATVLELQLDGKIEITQMENKDINLKITNKDVGTLKNTQIIILNFIKRLTNENQEITIKELKDEIRRNKKLYKDTFNISFIREAIREQEELGNCELDTKKYNEKVTEFIKVFFIGIFFSFITICFTIHIVSQINLNKDINFCIIPIPIFTTICTSIAAIIQYKVLKTITKNRKYTLFSLENNNTISCITFLTSKGKQEENKWLGFKKYLNEYTLINKYEVESIKINEEYLVYATLFGIADETQRKLGNYSDLKLYWLDSI